MSFNISGLIYKVKTNKLARLWVYAITGIVVLMIFSFMLVANYQQAGMAPIRLPNTPNMSYTSLVFNIGLKLGVVVLLIYVTLLVIKRWHTGKAGITKRQLNILETTHLSPRQTLHLVKLDHYVILIGATDQSITMLYEIDQKNENSLQTVETEQHEINRESLNNSFASLLVNRLLNHENKSTI
jgi:flagellar biogenesis protein FliO